MRILVLYAATGDDIAVLGQRRDDAIVRIALLAVVVDDARAIKARRFSSVETIVAHDIGDRRIDAALIEETR
ncbi:hypothetical protein D3C78_1940810 [compost metagenome]